MTAITTKDFFVPTTIYGMDRNSIVGVIFFCQLFQTKFQKFLFAQSVALDVLSMHINFKENRIAQTKVMRLQSFQ